MFNFFFFFKENFSKYCQTNRRKTERFKSSNIAKYAISHLKKVKKSNLVYTKFKNIAYALKLNQLMFLINLKYSNIEPISEAAWNELIVVNILKLF